MPVSIKSLLARFSPFVATPLARFWLGFVLLLILAAWLRADRLDMPPVDYPADRQRTNMNTVETLLDESRDAPSRPDFLELPILPWVTARTSWIARGMDLELWTWARAWSLIFGLGTVAGAAAVGFLAAGPPLRKARRRRLALLFMLALAIHPYHVFISRTILTESVTLFLQMATLIFFWLSWREPRRWIWLVLCAASFALAGAAKIPSLYLLPPLLICFLSSPRYAPRLRLGICAALLLAVVAVFWVYRLNPFTLLDDYSRQFAWFAGQTRSWMGSEAWTRTYVTRLALMLTLPGILFALLGLLRAPWLFRIAMLSFLVLFYPLVNLNTYNFVHAIIPGMALVAWGVDGFLRLASTNSDSFSRWNRLRTAWATALLIAIVLLLYPLGPSPASHPRPRADVLQAAEAIRQSVPEGAIVRHDEPEGALGYLLGQQDDTLSREFDLRTGYYFSLDRFSPATAGMAARSWVAWASLPGEPRGALFARRTPDAAQAAPPEDYVAVPGATPEDAPSLVAETFYVPGGQFDASSRVLRVFPGDQVVVGIQWRNPDRYRLAGIRWSSEEWRRYVPVPLRSGGFGVQYGGVLCLPGQDAATAYYTFEIPVSLPIGSYFANYYALPQEHWTDADSGFVAFPFTFLCEQAERPSAAVARDFADLYPMRYDHDPRLWSGGRHFSGARVVGYETMEEGTILSCPMSEPGVYEFALIGDARPVPDGPDPDDQWPRVDVYLPEARDAAAASVRLGSSRTQRHRAEIVAHAAFDSIRIHIPPARGRQMEKRLWTFDFELTDLGRQVLSLRGAELELKRPIFKQDNASKQPE